MPNYWDVSIYLPCKSLTKFLSYKVAIICYTFSQELYTLVVWCLRTNSCQYHWWLLRYKLKSGLHAKLIKLHLHGKALNIPWMVKLKRSIGQGHQHMRLCIVEVFFLELSLFMRISLWHVNTLAYMPPFPLLLSVLWHQFLEWKI